MLNLNGEYMMVQGRQCPCERLILAPTKRMIGTHLSNEYLSVSTPHPATVHLHYYCGTLIIFYMRAFIYE